MTGPMNNEPTDTVVLLRALANDKALDIGRAWNALEHAANAIEALRTLENPIRSTAEPVAWMMVNPTHLPTSRQLFWEPKEDWHITWEAVPLYAAPPPRTDPPEVDEAVRNACQAAAAWMDSHGEQVFAGGGWPAVESMNATRAALTAALKPAAGSV